MKRRSDLFRIRFFLFLVFIAFGLVLYKLFVLSYLKHGEYSRTAEVQNINSAGAPVRGNIYFTDKAGARVLAAGNKKFPVVAITASKIPVQDSRRVAEEVAAQTGNDPEDILKIIDAHGDYERPTGKHLTPEQVQKVKDLKIEGIRIATELDRYYPNQHLAADVLGFLGYIGSGRSGQYGVEAYYNDQLLGRRTGLKSLFSRSAFSTISRLLKRGKSAAPSEPVDDPKDIVLTIDKNVQKLAEDTLEALMKKWSAAGGSIIVQEPATGKILALADRPNFDPNNYGSAEPEMFLNGSVQQIFEPGSSFKPVTMAAGLDLGKITPQTTYEDKGRVIVAGYEIKNFNEKAFGLQTMTQVLEKSLNTGTMFVEGQIGDDNFLNYIINLGFGQKTGIDLPGEVSGNISNLYSGRKINYLTASFGQGIAVTPLQLINAFSAIANGGRLMRPFVVQSIVSSQGVETVTKPEIAGIPLTEKATAKLKTMLVAAVDNGFDKARIKGYDIAAKTGTAQIADAKGGYMEDEFIHNILGFAPAYDPKFTVMIKIDKPKGITFAADSLSPALREMMEFLINYYNVPPTR